MVRKRKQAEDTEETTTSGGLSSLMRGAKRLQSRVWNPDSDQVGDELVEDNEREIEYYPALGDDDEKQHCVGQLIAIDRHVGEFDSSMLRFVDPRGNEFATWQRGTLKTQVTEAQMGKFLLIVFKGLQPATKKGRDDMNLFDVFTLTEKQFDAYGKEHKEFSF